MSIEGTSPTASPPDPTNPQARRPLEPGEAETGAHALEAWTWAKQQAPNEPGAWQVLSAQYAYKKYGELPSGGRPGWEHDGGGGAYGWELKDGDLVPKDRSWFEKYGMLAITLGVLSFGTLSAVTGAAPVAGGAGTAGTEEGGALASLGGGGGAVADVGAGATIPGGIEAGSFGVGADTVAGLGTGAMGTVPVGVGVTAPTVGTGAAIVDAAAGNGSWDAAGNFIGPSTVSNTASSGGIGSTLKNIANSSWFPAAIGVAGNLGGALIQSNASEHAADLQAQSTKDALDFAKSQAALEQKNFAPYLAAGTGALSKLSYGLGIGDQKDYNSNGMPATPPGGSPGSITPLGDPQVSPHSPAAQFIANTRESPTWIIGPDGVRGQVPANQVQHYLDKGATLVPGQGSQGGALSTLGRTAPTGAPVVGTAVGRMA